MNIIKVICIMILSFSSFSMENNTNEKNRTFKEVLDDYYSDDSFYGQKLKK